MIKLETLQITGWEPAFHGMRNPMNSWEKGDSYVHAEYDSLDIEYVLGPNDHGLAMRLAKGGSVHAKYRRMIAVYVDITAPLYWWKEFDTYKVGTVSNSCSTMHKIHAKEFEWSDFSCEKMRKTTANILKETIDELNRWRDIFINGGMDDNLDGTSCRVFPAKDKNAWEQMIQLLPSSYNQQRTIMLNYEVLVGMYRDRKNHKLDEWRELCKWIESLPYSELITGESVVLEDESRKCDGEEKDE